MSNLLLVGPPGVGKTTSVHALAHSILGDHAKQAVLEMNASDDRGLDVVREKIKSFCRTKIDLPVGTFKIIILDEVDSMTTNAQQALRTTMEEFAETTRFALACNESSKVLEPIQSRTAILRFSKVLPEDMKRRLVQIMEMEKCSYDESGLQALVFVGNGDMRLAINSLQSVHIGFGHVSEVNVYRVCDAPNPVAIEKAMAFVLQKDWKRAYEIFADLEEKGYNPIDVIGVLTRVIKYYDMREEVKFEFLRETAELHGKAVQGFTSQLQFDALVSKLCLIAPAH